jgi:two-component system, OmpR family, phosphate regulon sensor histidine kinase PhoR
MWPITRPATERRIALGVVVVFLIAGAVWILLTDVLLYSVVQDKVVIARVETAKGWAFVGLTALLVYAVTRRSAAQLAKSNSTISAVVESIGDGLLILGSDRVIAYANPAAIRMLRAANPADLRGMGAPEFSRRFHLSYPDGHLIPPDEFVSQRVFDEAGPLRYKALLYPPGAPEVVVSSTAAGVRTEIGMPAEIVVNVLHDITATEHLERLRDEVFTTVAHAIKTPVAIIKSACQMMSDTKLSDPRLSTALIERQCSRIERLVENLLALSRIRSGTLQLYPAEVELRPIIEQVTGEIARLSRGHDIRHQFDDEPRVRADRERLVLALRNEIHAATRLSRQGSPVTVRLERRGADTEIGLSYSPDPAIGSDDDGRGAAIVLDDMGVSRYVTTMIVQAHGGTLIQNVIGGSTTVRIRLPVLEGAV